MFFYVALSSNTSDATAVEVTPVIMSTPTNSNSTSGGPNTVWIWPVAAVVFIALLAVGFGAVALLWLRKRRTKKKTTEVIPLESLSSLWYDHTELAGVALLA